MKEFDLFASKCPPEYSLRKPTAVMLAQFRGIASRASGLLAGIRVRKLRGRPPKVGRPNGLYGYAHALAGGAGGVPSHFNDRGWNPLYLPQAV